MCIDQLRPQDVRMARAHTDDQRAILHFNPIKPGDAIDIDQRTRPGHAKIEHRNEALATCQNRGVVAMRRQQLESGGHCFRPDIFEARGLHPMASSGSFPRARNTTKGVIGSRAIRTPSAASASLTALSTAAGAPQVPASPAPFAPTTEPS